MYCIRSPNIWFYKSFDLINQLFCKNKSCVECYASSPDSCPFSTVIMNYIYKYIYKFISQVNIVALGQSIAWSNQSPIARFVGPTQGPSGALQHPGMPHVGPMNFAIWNVIEVTLNDFCKIHRYRIITKPNIERIICILLKVISLSSSYWLSQ